jgi:hypothetical protein
MGIGNAHSTKSLKEIGFVTENIHPGDFVNSLVWENGNIFVHSHETVPPND